MTARIAVAVLALVASAPAAGQEWLERTYVEAKAGIATPRHDDLRAYGAAPALELAAGYRAHRNLALQLSVSRFAFETDPVDVGLTPSPSTQVGTLVLRERLIPVMLDARGVLPLGRVELYALAGVGACFSTLSSTLFLDGDFDDNAWAFEGGAGLALRLGDRITATADARWLRTEATYHGVQSILIAGAMKPRLDSAVIAAGLAFRL